MLCRCEGEQIRLKIDSVQYFTNLCGDLERNSVDRGSLIGATHNERDLGSHSQRTTCG